MTTSEQERAWIFSHRQTLNFYDCGPAGTARLSTLMKLLGMTADLDYVQRGMSHEFLQKRGFAFLVSRESMRIHRPLCEGETVTCTTWEHGIEGPMFYRCFELFDGSGALAVSGNTGWILIQPETRKILRPAAFTGEYRMLPERPVDAPKPVRIKPPADAVLRGEREIRYSDLDANEHMNNANYGNVVQDFLDAAQARRQIRAFCINFNHEAVLGDRLSVYTATDGDAVTVSAELQNEARQNCFTAKVEF